MTKPTTLIEVARLAGVSTATVNRVLKGVGYVSADSRARIETAIKTTRYRPNALARELRKQRSMTIGHVVSAITANPFFASVARGAEDEALERGFRTLLFNHNGSAERERQGLERFIERRVDAVLFTVVAARADVAMLIEEKIPVVQVERAATRDAPSVTVDNAVGALEAMRHFIALGHRRVALVGGDPEQVYSGDPLMRSVEDERLGAYRAGLAAAGLAWNPAYERLGQYYRHEDGAGVQGYLHMRSLLAEAQPPTAVFATCDILAAGVLQAIYEAGLRVPDDISVIGFDDTLAINLAPRLTTVAQPMEELGREGFRLALAQIEGSDEPRSVRLPSRLVIRASAGPAPAVALGTRRRRA
jgi:DNA-binding LacI/PurR family transcriptional regulator